MSLNEKDFKINFILLKAKEKLSKKLPRKNYSHLVYIKWSKGLKHTDVPAV